MARPHTSLRNRRSVWERLSPDYRQDDPAHDNVDRHLGDRATLPADVRQEARAAAAERGVPIHVFCLKSGEYRGVTANDARGLARYEKIATRITIVRPPRGSAAERSSSQASGEGIPDDVMREATIGAREHGQPIVVFRLKSGEYRGVTEDDAKSLARYRKSAVELGTVPVPAVRTPKPAEEEPEPAPPIPTPPRPRGRPRKPRPETTMIPNEEPSQPAEEPMRPKEPEQPESSINEPPPPPITPPVDREQNDLDEARTRMNKLEELLKNAIQ